MYHLTRRGVISALLLTAFAIRARATPAKNACPGVDPVNGARPELSPAAINPTLPPAREVPPDWLGGAMDLVSTFEAGRRDRNAAYGNVSTTDVISLGYLQWNYNAGSLFTTLLKDATPPMIDAAHAAIRDDISRLSRVGSGNKRDVLGLIQGWKSKNGTFKATRRTQLEEWLRSQPMRDRQDKLLARRFQSALQRSDAWQIALGQPTDGKAAQRAFYTFVDIEVFNGDLNGLWVPHVQAFRSQFTSSTEMMDFISGWVDDCASFFFARQAKHEGKLYSPKYRKLYRRKETPLSMAEWRRLLAANDSRLDDSALNLIALGYLRALRSNGSDYPNGFGGVFELDVLNRRGMTATGVGVLPGEKTVTELFSL